MRVLYFARTLTVCGIEPHIMTLGRGMMAAGWEVALASDGGDNAGPHGVEWFTSHGFRHYKVAFPSPEKPAANLGRALKSPVDVRSAIADFRPDLIHVHYRVTSVYARIAQLLYKVPFVTTLHLTHIPHGRLHRLASYWGKLTIAISDETRDYLQSAFGVDESRIRLVHNGVDDSYYRPASPVERLAARRKLGVEPEPAVVALIGRMSRAKAHDVFLRALARLRQQGCRVVALLAGVSIEGDTAWRDAMQAMAADLGVADQVRFLGFVEARDVCWAADLTVLPSRQEGFPLVVIESMLSGVVPIRTPAGGASQQIDDGQNGFIVPFEDSDSLSDRIRLLIEDSDLRRQMAAAARKKALSSFSAAAMVKKTLDVYGEILPCAGAPGRDGWPTSAVAGDQTPAYK